MISEERKERLSKKYASSKAGPGKGGKGPGGPGRGPGMPIKKPQDTKKAIKRLLTYLSKDMPLICIVFVCVIVSTVASLVASYMLRPVINSLTNANGTASRLLTSLVTMFVVYLVGVAAHYLQQRIMVSVAQRTIERIRNELFVKMQKLPVRFYDTNNHGDVMSRFTNDLDNVSMMLDQTIIQIISSAINVVGTLFLMIYTNVWLTIVTVVSVPLMMKAAGFLAGKSRRYYSSQQAALGTLNGYIEETVTGQKVVKVFCHEDIAVEEF